MFILYRIILKMKKDHKLIMENTRNTSVNTRMSNLFLNDCVVQSKRMIYDRLDHDI